MHAHSGPCTRGATAFVHQIGPATLSDISLRRRQPTRRRSSQAQCFSGQPSDTQAVKTTGQAEHTCSTPSLGTAPTHGNYPRLALLGCTPSAASAPAVPQPSSTGSAQRHPSPRAAAETTDPVEMTCVLCNSDTRSCGPCTHSARPLSTGLPSDTQSLCKGRPSNTLHALPISFTKPTSPSDSGFNTARA